MHALLTHTSPLLHAWPQLPQFAVSFVVSAQYGAPASGVHSVSPPPSEAHVRLHFPFEHTSPTLHWTPQPPQFALSVFVLAQYVPPSPAGHDV